MKPIFSLAMTTIVLFVLTPANIFACACCAERGAYFVSKGTISEYDFEMLPTMRFGADSQLYLEAGEFESIKGLDILRKAYYSKIDDFNLEKIGLAGIFSQKAWTLNFDPGKGLKGSLILPLPDEMESFKIDIHDGRSGSAGGPLLYKELRFRGKLKAASGFFGVPSGTNYSLIFQGRGNVCDNAEDFTHWRLDFNEPEADFSFSGKMASGNPEYFFGGGDDKGVDSDLPKFEDFEIAVTTAKPKAINFSSHKNARMFQARLREAWRDGVNFAGSFIFTSWGCGTGCQVGAIIDAKTGAVYFPEEMAGMGFGIAGSAVADEPMEYRKDSSLFILRGSAANGTADGTTCLVWNGKRFEQIKFIASGGGSDLTDPGAGSGSDYLITNESAGKIRIGMTIGEVQKILPAAKFLRGPGEGEDVIEVIEGGVQIMAFSAREGGEDYEAPIKTDTRITGIVILDSRFATAAGVRTGMTVSEAEAKYGKLKDIWLVGLTGDEYATFSDHPKGIRISVGRQGDQWGPEDLAGVYRKGEDKTARYVPGAVIKTISVSGTYE